MDKYMAVVDCAPNFAPACVIRTPRCTSGSGLGGRLLGASQRGSRRRRRVCSCGKRRRSLFRRDCVTPAESSALLLQRRRLGVAVSDLEIRKRDATMAPQWIRPIVRFAGPPWGGGWRGREAIKGAENYRRVNPAERMTLTVVVELKDG